MMVVLEAINWFFNVANKALDIVLPWVLLFVLLIYPVFYLIRGIRKVNKETRQSRNKVSSRICYPGLLFYSSLQLLALVFFGDFLNLSFLARGWSGRF